MEQGWDLAWVWAQIGEKTEIRMGEPQPAGQAGQTSASVASTGPRIDKDKHKAVPASGPVRQGCMFCQGILLPSIGVLQVWFEEAQAEAARWRLEVEELRQERVRGYALAQEWEEELGRTRRKWDKAVH
ncbi:hypothetical protein C0992_003331, partial [Termitomyces sp. T32_za158]